MVQTRSKPTVLKVKRRQYSIEDKQQMVTLWLLGHSFRSIGRTFDPPVAPGTIKGIIAKWEETGKVRNKSQTGRNCLLNDEALKELEQLVKKDGDTRRQPTNEITAALNTELDIKVSERTVRRALKKTGLGCHPAVVKP